MKKPWSKSRLLAETKKRLGLGQERKEFVFKVAALRLGVPPPKNKADGYKLLNQFCGGFVAKPAASPDFKGDVNSPEFLESYQWRRLRIVVLKKYGARCGCCGATSKEVRLHVDHIKPRRLFPALALVESNLQVLCEVCNHGKGNWDQTDWREPQPVVPPQPPVSAPRPLRITFDEMRPRLVKR